jgi:intracellular sulfur oxidation DsrE/DsrF family protein
MMKWTIAFVLLGYLSLAAPAQAGFLETKLADPKPDFDAPRKIMLQISTNDEKKINDVLWNAVNLQKFYGIDNVKIAIVVFGPGMVALYRESSPVRERIESLMKYEVSFVGCENTMDATQHEEADLIEGVEFVQAGIAEIVERQLEGWIYVHP